jgi:hypothetical protein
LRTASTEFCTRLYRRIYYRTAVVVAEWPETLTAVACVASNEADEVAMYRYVCLPCGSPSQRVLDQMASISSHAFIRKQARSGPKCRRASQLRSRAVAFVPRLADPLTPHTAPSCCTALPRYWSWHWQTHVGTIRTYIQYQPSYRHANVLHPTSNMTGKSTMKIPPGKQTSWSCLAEAGICRRPCIGRSCTFANPDGLPAKPCPTPSS